jgi:hypothetical protein
MFLCLALHSLQDKAIFNSPASDFLDAHDTAFAALNLRAVLQPEGMRKSACDIHELLFCGAMVGTGIPAGDLMDSHLRFKVYASPGKLFLCI